MATIRWQKTKTLRHGHTTDSKLLSRLAATRLALMHRTTAVQ